MNEERYNYPASDLEWRDKSSPTSVEAAPKAGKEYYENYLKPVMPGLLKNLDILKTSLHVDDKDIACVFLDRDTRPAMHAFKAFTPDREFSVMPMVASPTLQFKSLADVYQSFARQNWKEIQDPDTYSDEFEKYADTTYARQSVEHWVASYRKQFQDRLGDKKLIVPIDIGYRGSGVEVARYLLHKAFPDIPAKSLLLYKYSNDIPIRSVTADSATWYAESSIPHTTSGYSLDTHTNSFKYLKIKGNPDINHSIESAFYRGVIQAATKDREEVK